MNFKTRLNNIKTRFKAASKAFLNPMPTLKPRILIKTPEPSIVIDNQLLAGKNVLITGGGINIGRSIALEMAKQGANIFFTDIVQQRCQSLEKELNAYPIQSKGFLSDISKNEDIDSIYSYLNKNELTIDILVNNVGVHDTKNTIKDIELEELKTVFNTNILGPMYLTKLLSEMMIVNNIHGSIIFITSIHQDTIRRLIGYSSSKAALGMIIKELAIDLAAHKIRVNGIAPGWITEDNQGNTFIHKYTPLYNSSINPSYIGRAAVYLASDYFSQFTTGTVLKIDAGLSLYNYFLTQDSVL